jgi:hypothetical protein
MTEIAVLPIEFKEFLSIARLSREMVVTEKIDGTNAQVHVTEDGRIFAGSRNRWITPEADNFGFARWVQQYGEELRQLGPGSHYGEWWGSGIQRGYGLEKGEKRFSLFNVARWADDRDREKYPVDRPPCCHVVPILYRGLFDSRDVDENLERLQAHGSYAAKGFMKPEGVVVFHVASGQLFKKTLDKNDGHKSASRSGPNIPEGAS